jgi:hypothetical protein
VPWAAVTDVRYSPSDREGRQGPCPQQAPALFWDSRHVASRVAQPPVQTLRIEYGTVAGGIVKIPRYRMPSGSPDDPG